MVKYNPKTWFALIFHSYSRQVVRTLFPALFFMGTYTTVIIYILLDFFDLEFISTHVVHSLLGIVLGLFLVFRINSAYDRWWEGRKLWGLLLNNSRNLSSKLSAYLPANDIKNRNFFIQMISNFAFATKEHLRGGVDLDDLEVGEEGLIERLKNIKHIPNAISLMIYERINKLYINKELSAEQFFVLDKEVKEFSDILGGCERIKNTPIPYSYSMFIKKFIFTYTITLPFAFMTEFKYWTIPIVLMVFFILVSVELIAEEIEDPFGRDINDLPTDDMCKKINNNISELLLIK